MTPLNDAFLFIYSCVWTRMDVVQTLPWTAGEEDVQSSVRSKVNTQMSMSDKSTESYLCLVPVITEGHQSCGSHQVSSCTKLSEKVKSNAHDYPSRDICKLQSSWGKDGINSDICVSRSESIASFPLNAFKPKHWFTGISIRQWPVLLCDCIYQASDGVHAPHS